MNDNTRELLALLWRGGTYANYWTKSKPGSTRTTWVKLTGNIPNPPKSHHIFFGVHPCTKRGSSSQRSTVKIIEAVNCLFAEFDSKDFEGSIARTRRHIDGLPMPPSALISSGGGYHAYWIFRDPYKIETDDQRAEIDRIQKGWVHLTGGDPGAADLARVLRVPGTQNNKYEPPRSVNLEYLDTDIMYDLDDLAAFIPEPEPVPEVIINGQPFEAGPDLAQRIISTMWSKYAPRRNETGYEIAKQLRDNGFSKADAWPILQQFQRQVENGGDHKFTEDEIKASWKSAYAKPAREPWTMPEKIINGSEGKITMKEPGPEKELTVKAEVSPEPREEIKATVRMEKAEQPAEISVKVEYTEPPTDPGLTAEKRKTSWTIAELYDTEFPEPKWALPGIIPVGVSILAGRPKIGKSWLALQIAHAVATGGKVFGIDVEQGRVLFLAFEDSGRRLKKRSLKQGIPYESEIEFHTEWLILDKGGFEALQVKISKNVYSLIIIDTISRAMGKADQLDVGEMTYVMGQLQNMAQTADITILVIDHHPKAKGYTRNPTDDVFGSTGKAATADCNIGLYTEQGKKGATFMAEGRDFDNVELALVFDRELCCWQSLGSADEVHADSAKGKLLQAATDLISMGELATVTNMAKHAEMDKGNASRLIKDLITEGRLKASAKIGKQQPFEVIDGEELQQQQQ